MALPWWGSDRALPSPARLVPHFPLPQAACNDHRQKFAVYSYLWNQDQKAAFAAFCERAYVPLPKSEDQVKG